jgi:hypothetical protein
LSGGLGHSSLGLAVSSNTQSAARRLSEDGLQGAVGLIWRVSSRSSVNLRASRFVNDSFNSRREELFFALGLGEYVSLRAGYADWKVTNSTGMFGLDSNPIELNFSGPTLSLGLDF